MIALLIRSVSYCFGKRRTLYVVSTRPATPRTEPRFRTAHPGGLLVFGGSLLQQSVAA